MARLQDGDGHEFCSNILKREKIKSFSASKTTIKFAKSITDVVLMMGSSVQFDRPEDDKCEMYFEKARLAFATNDMTKTKNFDEEVDRIEILDRWGNKMETCYNVEKLGRYGVCQTQEAHPYQWGFCSKSCQFYQRSSQPALAYEQAEFLYFEDAPFSSDYEINLGT